MVEIIGEFRAGLLLAVDHPGPHEGAFLHVGPQFADQIGILGELFRQDIARALKCCLGIDHLFGQIGQRQFSRHQ